MSRITFGRSILCIALCFILVSLLHIELASAQFRTDPPSLFVPRTPAIISECDFCMGAQGISPLEMGHTGLRYDVRYLQLSKPYDNGHLLPNSNNDKETHFTQQVTFLYHFLPAFSASILVPFSSRHESSISGTDPFTGEDVVAESHQNFGLADIILLGRYNILMDHNVADTRIWSINAGVKLPTGNTKAQDASGELLDPDLQLGTGSTDWIVGTSFLLAWERFSLASNLSQIFTGHGANNHSYGNNLSYDLTARYRVYPSDFDFPAFFGTLGITGEYRAHETTFDPATGWTSDPDSGGDITYLAHGLQIFFSPVLSFEGNVQIPIIHALNGQQLGETVRIMSGIQYMLPY